jgi:DNA protecting protein DprA
MTSTELNAQPNWRNEALAFLALSSVKGIGYWTMRGLADLDISYYDFLKLAPEEELESLLRLKLPSGVSSWDSYRIELWDRGIERARRLSGEGIGLIFPGQSEFPDNLKNIPDAPAWLFVQGELSNLHSKSVAIVGTRKPTEDGIFLTRYLVAALAHSPYPTVSGLALGIDQVVHVESIRYSIPTIAVLGTGINGNYPKGSEGVRQAIIDSGGTIVTEYLLGQSYSAENFVRRNRLQAALCNTLFPVEWKIKSGTAHTVEFASKYNKKIANLFLPNTYHLRPELEFSVSTYGAVACEVPEMTNLILEFVRDDPVTLSVQHSLDL